MLLYLKRLIALFFVLVLGITPSFFTGSNYSNCTITDNDKLTVYLESNPTTGYDWEYKVSDESVIKFEKADYKQNFSVVQRDGAGGMDIFTFKGIAQGDFSITLTYARSWENEPANKTCTVIGTVDEGGNVKVTSFEIV